MTEESLQAAGEGQGYRGALAGAGAHDCSFTAGQHTKSPTLTLAQSYRFILKHLDR